MSNPVTVALTAGVWTKVATAVTNAFVYRLDTASVLRYTYRNTGDPAPTGTFYAESAIGIPDIGRELSYFAPSDVYIIADRDCSVRIDDGGGGGGGSVVVQGDVDHDDSDSGNPVKIGAVARSSQQAAVADGDRVDLVGNLNGELVQAGYDWVTGTQQVIDRKSKQPVDLVSASYTVDTAVYIDVGNYEGVEVSVTWVTGGTATLKIYTTPQNDGTVAASCQYTDRSLGGIDILDGTTPAASYVNNVGFTVDVSKSKYLLLDLTSVSGDTVTLYVNGVPK